MTGWLGTHRLIVHPRNTNTFLGVLHDSHSALLCIYLSSHNHWSNINISLIFNKNVLSFSLKSLSMEDIIYNFIYNINEWLPTPVFLPGEFHGQRSLAGYSHWGLTKSQTWLWLILLLWAPLLDQMVKNLPAMQETRVLSLSWEDLLEKGMAPHSSILAWRIPWVEQPHGL